MLRGVLAPLMAAAIYGFAVGLVHSPCFALRNLLKFPLLMVATAAFCAPGYVLLARLVGTRAAPGAILHTTLAIFRHTSLLLAALAPACALLALTTVRPDQDGLGGYPLFLGLNVLFVALCGTLALVQQTRRALRRLRLSRRRGVVTVTLWLALTLLVGGQWAWTLRPFLGVSRAETPLFLGSAPDFRGATNIYEAVLHLLRPPPLPRDFLLHPSATVAAPHRGLDPPPRWAGRPDVHCAARRSSNTARVRAPGRTCTTRGAVR